MIDVTYDSNILEIELTEYSDLGNKKILKEALTDLLNKACYSGETITLWEVQGKEKLLVGEFQSAAKRR